MKEFPEFAEFLDVATSWITKSPWDAIRDEDDWVGAMQNMGPTSNLQA